MVQGVVLLRKGQESLPALRDVMAKIDELNKPGKLPPGMKIVAYYNRTDLINRTTETVNENLLVGMALVTAILLMFLGNVRAAIIVAINIPLALLFAFGVLYARGKSANLLSIGAVDFGIIVDSSVIIVESIYRHLSSDEHPEKPLRDRISAACGAVTKSLFFATVVMVCALLPLFSMKGPEGQIFGPMADTHSFALAGALFFALTVSPVLCLLLLRKRRQVAERWLLGKSPPRSLVVLVAPRDSGPAEVPVRAWNWWGGEPHRPRAELRVPSPTDLVLSVCGGWSSPCLRPGCATQVWSRRTWAASSCRNWRKGTLLIQARFR